MAQDLNIDIGKRLRLIRHFFNEGRKLSAEQFGHLLGESRDNIMNYESGRAGVPVRVLFELFTRGINPIFIIAGEGDVFTANEAGTSFKERLQKRNFEFGEVTPINIKVERDDTRFRIGKVAAGELKPKI